MSRSFCALCALGFAFLPLPQATAAVITTSFENVDLPANSYSQNAGPSGFFEVDDNAYNNTYSASYDSWSGWALSSKSDTTTAGYLNQYSAITGSGADGSSTYAVAFTFGYPTADPLHPSSSFINLAAGASPLSIEVTNTTYAYLAMRDGDPYGFSHPFGAGDFFELSITGYSGLAGSGQKIREIDFYLANFLGANHDIVDTWQTLDLSSLAGSVSVVFGLRSSDNDIYYGMNTPAYFAIDNLRFETATSAVPEPSSAVTLLGGIALLAGAHSLRRSRAALLSLGLLLGGGLGSAKAGIYDPQVGQPGSLGIPKSSSLFQEWASSVVSFNPGPQNISNSSSPLANFGSPSNVLGDNGSGIVSLGDGGSITLGFDKPIANGPGADFAVFENGFLSGSNGLAFLELAFVEVSSDGVHFFRFPDVSLTQTETQVGGFGLLDASNLHDLAGKYIAGYGTGFDLEELAGISPLLNINHIIEVRITDVVGSINPLYGTRDSLGNMINDPFPTPFGSGGFDLNGLGVINMASVPEPSSLALVAGGLGVAAMALKRQRRSTHRRR